MRIGKADAANISQILSSVEDQSGTAMEAQSSLSLADEASGWSTIEAADNIDSTDFTEDQDPGWFIDTCGDTGQSSEGQYQSGSGAPGLGAPPGFEGCSDGSHAAPQFQGQGGPSTSHLLPMGGVTGPQATPIPGLGVGEAGSGVEDAKLRDELLEARSSNSRYKKMLVSLFLCQLWDHDD